MKLYNTELKQNLQNGKTHSGNLRGSGYVGNGDNTWAIDDEVNDTSYLYTSELEYNNDIKLLKITEELPL